MGIHVHKKTDEKVKRRLRIKLHIRKKISGTGEKPRLVVFKSNSEMYAQLIDDLKMTTICSASSIDKGIKGELSDNSKMDKAKAVGKLIAQKGVQSGVKTVVFDRNGFAYHGCVKALADAARENGFEF